MFGRKKMIPAGFAAMGILIAAMAFVGGCGTQNTDQNDQTNVSVEVSACALKMAVKDFTSFHCHFLFFCILSRM